MHLKEDFYAVQISGATTKRPALALGAPAGPALHYWRGDAVKFRNRLRARGVKHARVVKIRATYNWV